MDRLVGFAKNDAVSFVSAAAAAAVDDQFSFDAVVGSDVAIVAVASFGRVDVDVV